MPLLEVFGNILIPALSGLFLFIYFLYFVFIEETKSVSTQYFTIFLISFSLFLFGRPLQILAGPHPLPLIINNIRSLIFSSVTVPLVMLADFSRPQQEQKSRFRRLILLGTILGILYCIFNSLTSTGSEVIFRIGSISAFDSVTPSLTAPFYGREITNGVYLILATFLILDSLGKIRKAGSYGEEESVHYKKINLYNGGKLFFALTFFLGTLLHEWWIYYAGSLVSVTFLGSGVGLDIRENRERMHKVITYIREDLMQDLSINVHIHQQVSEILKLLQVPEDINTFIAFKESNGKGKINPGFRDINDSQLREISSELDKLLGVNRSILMPMGMDMLGICLSIPRENDLGRSQCIAICEYLKKNVKVLASYDFGIGRSYSGLEDLKKSYNEAVQAVEYAKSIEGGQVIHISDLQDEETRREYPLKERNAFLAAIRMGDRVKALEQLEILMNLLFRYGSETDKLLKVRIYELLGTMIESAMAGGGDVDRLLELSEKLFSESSIIRSQAQLIEWLKSRTIEIIEVVSFSHSNRSKNIVRKAKDYINEHFSEAISVKDVADAVCISESYFKSIFKKNSGFSYSEYLTKVRMDQAMELLITTEKSVTEIAMDVGYQTPNSFSSLFKREIGLTPTQYKSSHRTDRVN